MPAVVEMARGSAISRFCCKWRNGSRPRGLDVVKLVLDVSGENKRRQKAHSWCASGPGPNRSEASLPCPQTFLRSSTK